MTEVLDIIEHLYGLSPLWKEGVSFERVGTGAMIYRTAWPAVPEVWNVESSGIPFLHLRGKHIKPTTCAARILVPFASQSVIDIQSVSVLRDYLARKELQRTDLQVRGELLSSVPLVAFRGVGIGTARRLKGGKFESLFPAARF